MLRTQTSNTPGPFNNLMDSVCCVGLMWNRKPILKVSVYARRPVLCAGRAPHVLAGCGSEIYPKNYKD